MRNLFLCEHQSPCRRIPAINSDVKLWLTILSCRHNNSLFPEIFTLAISPDEGDEASIRHAYGRHDTISPSSRPSRHVKMKYAIIWAASADRPKQRHTESYDITYYSRVLISSLQILLAGAMHSNTAACWRGRAF